MIPHRVKFPDFQFCLFPGFFGPRRGSFSKFGPCRVQKITKQSQNRKWGNLTISGIIIPTYMPKIKQKYAFLKEKFNFSAIFWLRFLRFPALFAPKHWKWPNFERSYLRNGIRSLNSVKTVWFQIFRRWKYILTKTSNLEVELA